MTSGWAILVASHPRSGTHLVIDLLRRQFKDTGGAKLPLEANDRLYLNLERLNTKTRQLSESQAHAILARSRHPIMKTHFTARFDSSWIEAESTPPPQPFIDIAKSAAKIYVLRDVRDVMASYIQFLSGIDDRYADMPLETFGDETIWTGETRLAWWLRHVTGWAETPGILLVRYETLIGNPAETLQRLGGHIGLRAKMVTPLLPPKNQSLKTSRMNRLFGFYPASTSILANEAAFPRRRWREELSDNVARRWDTINAEALSAARSASGGAVV